MSIGMHLPLSLETVGAWGSEEMEQEETERVGETAWAETGGLRVCEKQKVRAYVVALDVM